MTQFTSPATTIAGTDLATWIAQAKRDAQQANVPLTELDWFIQTLVNVDRLALRLGIYRDRPAIPARYALAELQTRWQQRCRDQVPVQYLAEQVDWRQFRLRVTPTVLIPRPETELLIDVVLAAIAQSLQRDVLTQGQWADLGTGSGAIAIALATELPQAQVHAVDCSAAALAIAAQNAVNCGVDDRVQFHQGSWFTPLAEAGFGSDLRLAGMVSNPPYIPHQTIATLQPEVQHHEPHLALDGGADGLDAIRQLVSQAPDFLQPGGIWAIELMAGQAPTVAQLLANSEHYTHIQIQPDLAGIDRFVLGRLR